MRDMILDMVLVEQVHAVLSVATTFEPQLVMPLPRLDESPLVRMDDRIRAGACMTSRRVQVSAGSSCSHWQRPPSVGTSTMARREFPRAVLLTTRRIFLWERGFLVELERITGRNAGILANIAKGCISKVVP